MPKKSAPAPKAESWWGKFKPEPDEVIHWNIGPLELWATRGQQEWSIATSNKGEGNRETCHVSRGSATMPGEFQRFVFHQSPAEITLTPRLADRPIIVRPSNPLFLAPNQKVQLYICSPLWVEVTAEKPKIKLVDLPAVALTETWFGPNTITGDICYADQTLGRLNPEKMDLSAFRATTVATLYNGDDTNLKIERLRLPFQHLALYADREGHFWTQPIRFESERSHEMARVKIAEGWHPSREGKTLVSPEREKITGSLVRAFGSLLGGNGRWF